MKRKILPLIIFLLIMFSGCGGPAAANPDSLFHFPGLSWGMSPEEVKAALPIQDGEIEESPFSSAADYNSYTILWAPDQQVYFGEAAYHIFSVFRTGGKPAGISCTALSYTIRKTAPWGRYAER